MKTIDITPTWSGLLPALLAVIQDGETAEARQIAKDELVKMAKAADRYNEHTKKGDFSIHIAFGELVTRAIVEGEEVTEDMGGFITEKSFFTEAEKNAYLEALNDQDGFNDSYVLEGEEIEKYNKS
ncbi:MAG: hypothetical protein AAF391_07150 [Bacteroidota bacterium]